jgi:hypothetical protein
MKLILGEGSNGMLFRSEKGGSDDETSDGGDEAGDFESVANLQYLRLGEFWIISGPVTYPLRYDQGTVRQTYQTQTATRQNPKTRVRVVMKDLKRRRQNPLMNHMRPTLGRPWNGRMNLVRKRTRPSNAASRRIYEWMMWYWSSKRSGWPTTRIWVGWNTWSWLLSSGISSLVRMPSNRSGELVRR